jgi:hypothetical protein
MRAAPSRSSGVVLCALGRPVCDKCVELDKTIERYRRILLSIGDQVTVDRTNELIAELQAKKAALHPEQAK